ncbi:MAG: hypothetical protein LIR46_02095, partial [Bacteroidota bacterium]|nr:hypothetical protein [Bacteroidota bacterium]
MIRKAPQRRITVAGQIHENIPSLMVPKEKTSSNSQKNDRTHPFFVKVLTISSSKLKHPNAAEQQSPKSDTRE